MELLDVYNVHHVRTGRIIPRGTLPDVAAGERILICHVCVFSPSGRMLVQKRQDTKEVFPGRYDVSAGGFVRSGETSRQAVIREERFVNYTEDLITCVFCGNAAKRGI